MKHTLIVLASLIFAIFGVACAFMPIPGGVLIALLGISVLMYNSTRARQAVRYWRKRYSSFNRLFIRFELISKKRFPKTHEMLLRTRPRQEP